MSVFTMSGLVRRIALFGQLQALGPKLPKSLVTGIFRRPITLGQYLGQENTENKGTAEVKKVDPSKDRTKIISVETSIKYMKSKAFLETYGGDPVWKLYRRNHKGVFPPRRTRKTCIRQGIIATGNPCPICRDEYFVIDYTNIDLLKHFISPYTGEILSYTKTGVCQVRHEQLVIAIEKAKDYGFITFDVPFRVYDYSHYYKEYLTQ